MHGRTPQRAAQDGFTLVEVLVAMVLIGGSLMALVGLSTAGLKAQEAARQRQVANGLASEVMERLRGLPFAALTQGTPYGVVAADPNVLGCRIGPCASAAGLGGTVQAPSPGAPAPLPPGVSAVNGCVLVDGTHPLQALLSASVGSRLPLSPYNCTEYHLNDVVYQARAYVTTTANQGTLINGAPFRLTVIVTWNAGAASTVLQSMVYGGGSGCGNQSLGYVTGPCGQNRNSEYSASAGWLKIRYCRVFDTPNTYPSAVSACTAINPEEVFLDLGGLDFNWVEAAGVMTLTSEISSSSLTVGGSTVFQTAPLTQVASNAPAPSIIPANPGLLSVTQSATIAPGVQHPDTPIRILGGGGVYYVWNYLGDWQLKVTLGSASCLAGSGFMCGQIIPRATTSGSCSPGVSAPCLSGTIVYGGATVEVCKVGPTGSSPTPPQNVPPQTCQTLATLLPGTTSGQFTSTGSSISVSGYQLNLGNLGTVLPGSSGALKYVDVSRTHASGDPYGQDPPDLTDTKTWWAFPLSATTCQTYPWGTPTPSQSLGGTVCIRGSASASDYLRMTMSGSKAQWYYLVDNMASNCLPSSSMMVGYVSVNIPLTGNTVIERCTQIAPAFEIEWQLPSTSGTE